MFLSWPRLGPVEWVCELRRKVTRDEPPMTSTGASHGEAQDPRFEGVAGSLNVQPSKLNAVSMESVAAGLIDLICRGVVGQSCSTARGRSEQNAAV